MCSIAPLQHCSTQAAWQRTRTARGTASVAQLTSTFSPGRFFSMMALMSGLRVPKGAKTPLQGRAATSRRTSLYSQAGQRQSGPGVHLSRQRAAAICRGMDKMAGRAPLFVPHDELPVEDAGALCGKANDLVHHAAKQAMSSGKQAGRACQQGPVAGRPRGPVSGLPQHLGWMHAARQQGRVVVRRCRGRVTAWQTGPQPACL